MSDQIQIPFDPQQFDVVCTKLRTWNTKHAGNKFFNELVGKLAPSVKEETIKKTAEQLIEIIFSKGGRFLRLSDADCLSGKKPSMCTVLDQKQRITKVVRTLRTAYLKQNGSMPKRVRNPATRRKKTKTYELLSGDTPIHPYALQLLAAVMNGTRNVPFRELDKPGEPYTLETEPEQLRLMRLQLRHRLVGAKEAMMPAVEFGHALMNMWGGRVVVSKIPLPNAVTSADGAAAADNIVADKIGSSAQVTTNGAADSATSNTGQTKTTTPILLQPKPVAAATDMELQQKQNEAKDQLRAATRQKMKALMTREVGAGRPVRGSLASKTLPGMGDKITGVKTTTAQNNVDSAGKKSSAAERPKRGSLASKTLPAPKPLPARAAADKNTTKPVRGSLASKTLPACGATPKSAKKASPATRKKNAKKKEPSRDIGSLVRNLEQADTDSPFKSRRLTRANQTVVTSGSVAKVEALLGGKGTAPRKVSLPQVAGPGLRGIGRGSKN